MFSQIIFQCYIIVNNVMLSYRKSFVRHKLFVKFVNVVSNKLKIILYYYCLLNCCVVNKIIIIFYIIIFITIIVSYIIMSGYIK